MPTSRTLHILVGTVTNTAEYVAQAIELDCADLVDHIEVRLMDDLGPSVFSAGALYIICTSTFGEGDVPDNARALYDALDRPGLRLDGVRYGVIALGDSVYPQTFCNGGRRFDERLASLGAQRVGERLCLDASTEREPEARGAAWCRTWLAEALA
ncbi:MAG: flavodoxin domain-containing protein [Hydrogenophaga sp.]|jgi:MioC protein|nr:flavodoxin domain-containing protein [Hydrogenophaga sp.]